MSKKALTRREKIKLKIRKRISGSADTPRLVVFRSVKHIYGQLVDDFSAKTLMTVSSKSKEITDQLTGAKGKLEVSKLVGKLIAERAKKENISSVVFDRNGYLYHGRVKALAESAREGGLKF
ncbi:50S ribosomal protein L18 [soil metagenome]